MTTLRTPPRGIARFLARLPVWLYRLRLGRLLGGRFLLLEHRGRRTGAARRTVLEVVRHDRDSDTYYVAAAWGARAQWLRNVQAAPEVRITVGRRHIAAKGRRVSPEEAEAVLRDYADKHRLAMCALGRLLGSTDRHELAAVLPIVALEPRS